MKKCFKCGIWKTIDGFYKHPQMGDGHLNKCINCTKNDVKERENKLKENPDWIEKERKRGREKYHRLGYQKYAKRNYLKRRKSLKPYPVYINGTKSYKEKFPEKYRAKIISQRMKLPEGKQKHHWSYNEEHFKDILFLTRQEHERLHRYIIYDQERMMYRSLEGILLDTKEEHLRYYKVISGLE